MTQFDKLVHDSTELALGPLAEGVIIRATDYPIDGAIPAHTHAEHQLVHAVAGVMTVRTNRGAWVVPPGFAVWMPAEWEHAIRLSGAVKMRTLYIASQLAPGMADEPQVVAVPALLRAMLTEAAELIAGARPKALPSGAEERLAAVILDQVSCLRSAALHLPFPRDARARRIAESLVADPADRRAAPDLARGAGLTERSLARLFSAETGMSFGKWRRRRAVLAAVERLGAGEPVTTVALDLGYASLSAFSAMIRRETGSTPRSMSSAGL